MLTFTKSRNQLNNKKKNQELSLRLGMRLFTNQLWRETTLFLLLTVIFTSSLFLEQ